MLYYIELFHAKKLPGLTLIRFLAQNNCQPNDYCCSIINYHQSQTSLPRAAAQQMKLTLRSKDMKQTQHLMQPQHLLWPQHLMWPLLVTVRQVRLDHPAR